MILLILFFNLFSFSFQAIKAAFFCEDYLEEVYVVEGDTQRQITHGDQSYPKGAWNLPYYFLNLNASEGDLIRYNCKNNKKESSGAGCFFLDNNCFCYDFYVNLERGNVYKPKTATFDGKSCNINVQCTKEEVTKNQETYVYEHYIPLNATKITCKYNNNVVILRNGFSYGFNLSQRITTDFNIKNIETSITQSYSYFSLNYQQLKAG